jgi:hypothetical protein
MAHVQRKRDHYSEHKKEFTVAENASIANESRTAHEDKAPETKGPRDNHHTTVTVDEGGSWQFKFVMIVIAAGVLMLILKTIGLF